RSFFQIGDRRWLISNIFVRDRRYSSVRRFFMRNYTALLAAVAFSGGLYVAMTTTSVQSQTQPGSGFAAVPGEKGGWDITGPYEVVPDWPKPLSQLPGHEQWTWGATEAVFAESADRVFVIQLGELPKLQRPPVRVVPAVGPSLP